jgi:hypothetical protein
VRARAGPPTEIAAHVTGIAMEVTRHLEPYLQGDPVPKTRSFEEREAPLQALGHAELLRQLDSKETQMRRIVADVLEREPDAVIPWTGRYMAVAKFIPHLRNEHALHRWDVAGEDDISRQLLGNDDLVDHSVGELGEVLLVAGRKHDPDPDADFRVRLRSDGHRDLRVLVETGTAALAWADASADEPWIDIDPVARHIFIWGRRPDRHGNPDAVACVDAEVPKRNIKRLLAARVCRSRAARGVRFGGSERSDSTSRLSRDISVLEGNNRREGDDDEVAGAHHERSREAGGCIAPLSDPQQKLSR